MIKILGQKTLPEQKGMFDELKDAVDGYGKQMAGAFVSSVAAGEGFKETFKNITSSFLQNIAQMILQVGVIEPMLKRMKEAMASAGGGGIGSWVSSLFGFAHGGAFAGATGLPYGVYNQPTFFPMPGNGPLKKFARGGVLGEAGAEAILPLRRTAGGSLGVQSTPAEVNVNVINNAGAAVSVSQDSNGDTTILIEKANELSPTISVAAVTMLQVRLNRPTAYREAADARIPAASEALRQRTAG